MTLTWVAIYYKTGLLSVMIGLVLAKFEKKSSEGSTTTPNCGPSGMPLNGYSFFYIETSGNNYGEKILI